MNLINYVKNQFLIIILQFLSPCTIYSIMDQGFLIYINLDIHIFACFYHLITTRNTQVERGSQVKLGHALSLFA